MHTHPPVRTHNDIRRETNLSIKHSVKALVFRTVDGQVVLAAIPGDDRISYRRLADAVGVVRSQLKQADASQLEMLGMQPGGVSPICIADHVIVVFDTRVATMGDVYCGSGIPDRTIELDAQELIQIAPRSLVAPITTRD